MLICKYLGYIFLVKSGILTKLMRWICRVGGLSLPKRRIRCAKMGIIPQITKQIRKYKYLFFQNLLHTFS